MRALRGITTHRLRFTTVVHHADAVTEARFLRKAKPLIITQVISHSTQFSCFTSGWVKDFHHQPEDDLRSP